MHFDGFDTIEGRHLVFAYAAVFLIQFGYFGWIGGRWLKLYTSQDRPGSTQKSGLRAK